MPPTNRDHDRDDLFRDRQYWLSERDDHSDAEGEEDKDDDQRYIIPIELLRMVREEPADPETFRLVQQQNDRTGFAGIRADIVYELREYLGA